MLDSVIHTCTCSSCVAQDNNAMQALHHQINLFLSRLDEQQRRWYAALESMRIGHGGEQYIARITGLSEKTIRRGRRELQNELAGRALDQIRSPGGGRPALEVQDPTLVDTLEYLLVPETVGNPQGPGKYKRSSLRQLSACLRQSGHSASLMTVARLLRKRGYSLRVNARRKQAKASPLERDTQFQHIDEQKKDFLASGEPVISVDTKKKS